jgi:hypothetical protein
VNLRSPSPISEDKSIKSEMIFKKDFHNFDVKKEGQVIRKSAFFKKKDNSNGVRITT